MPNLHRLPPIERRIYDMRADGTAWKQIGSDVGLTIERVKQLHKQALQRSHPQPNTPQHLYEIERFGPCPTCKPSHPWQEVLELRERRAAALRGQRKREEATRLFQEQYAHAVTVLQRHGLLGAR